MSRQSMPGFTFKGISSDAMNIKLMRFPDIRQPDRKGKYEPVPGRDGDLWIDNGGYANVEYDLDCQTRPGANRSAVSAWLSGEGDLILNAEPNRSYRARIVKGCSFSRFIPSIDAYKIKVKISARPFAYQHPPETIPLTTGSMITNPGTVPSEPIITVYGSGDVNLLVGTSAVLINNVVDSVVIDCEAKLIYQPGTPMVLKTGDASLPGGVWPVMPVGTTAIQWTGAVSKVEIQPQWRWL